jgi:hypothetical protein
MKVFHEFFTITPGEDEDTYIASMPLNVFRHVIGFSNGYAKRHVRIYRQGKRVYIEMLKHEMKPYTRPTVNCGDHVEFITRRGKEIRRLKGFYEKPGEPAVIGIIIRKDVRELRFRDYKIQWFYNEKQ